MSEVDGEAGRLIVRGHAIEALIGDARLRRRRGAACGRATARAAATRPPSRAGLAAARVRAFAEVPKLLAATRGLNPVEALRVGIGMLPDSDKTPHHFLVCGAMPVFLAALLNAEKAHVADRARSVARRRRRISCA